MEEKEFAMSMYLNKEELYKAKSEYYEDLYKKTLVGDKDAGAEFDCSDGLDNPDYTKSELAKALEYLNDDHVTKNQHKLGCLGSSDLASATLIIETLIEKG